MKKFRTYSIAVQFYRSSFKLAFPRHLRDQLQRASSSIVLNIAEGAGRRTRADQRRFYVIAMGSLRECQAILELAEVRSSEVDETADKLGAHLYCLIKERG